jgi:hypothetical protein
VLVGGVDVVDAAAGMMESRKVRRVRFVWKGSGMYFKGKVKDIKCFGKRHQYSSRWGRLGVEHTCMSHSAARAVIA